jgi:hypothetical protein
VWKISVYNTVAAVRHDRIPCSVHLPEFGKRETSGAGW